MQISSGLSVATPSPVPKAQIIKKSPCNIPATPYNTPMRLTPATGHL